MTRFYYYFIYCFSLIFQLRFYPFLHSSFFSFFSLCYLLSSSSSLLSPLPPFIHSCFLAFLLSFFPSFLLSFFLSPFPFSSGHSIDKHPRLQLNIKNNLRSWMEQQGYPSVQSHQMRGHHARSLDPRETRYNVKSCDRNSIYSCNWFVRD